MRDNITTEPRCRTGMADPSVSHIILNPDLFLLLEPGQPPVC